MKQNPDIHPLISAWWPGGLTQQKLEFSSFLYIFSLAIKTALEEIKLAYVEYLL